MKSKALLLLLGILVAVGYTGLVFSLGSNSGAAKIQAEWNKDKHQRNMATRDLETKNAKLTGENKALTEQIDKELESYEKRHKESVHALRADYGKRLHHAEMREGIYREQAAGDALERERLASHAAQLDRSLEEGRYLVRELRETVGLRDSQIRELAKQIQADRALLQ